MRMKAVCEATGLTDRTVRYYIEEGLITPDYTESYTGRRTYDFCEADIHQLNDIAVLRKFGFTIAEIRDMLRDPARIMPTLETLRARKQAQIDEEQALMLALERITEPFGSVKELALALSAPVETALVPAEDGRIAFEDIFRNFLVALFKGMVAWSPVLISAYLLIQSWGEYEYSTFRLKPFALLTATLAPSIIILNWHKLRERFGWPVKIKKCLWILCVLSVPVCALFAIATFSHSETRDIQNYRILDSTCGLNRWTFAAQLLPASAHWYEIVQDANGESIRVDLDTQYYYSYIQGWEDTYDFYAEWPLRQEAFDEEVARVTALYDDTAQIPDDLMKITRTQKGPWICLFYHWGGEPFEEADWKYQFSIFAYDPESLRVRYIVCSSHEHGLDHPYYLELDWE